MLQRVYLLSVCLFLIYKLRLYVTEHIYTYTIKRVWDFAINPLEIHFYIVPGVSFTFHAIFFPIEFRALLFFHPLWHFVKRDFILQIRKIRGISFFFFYYENRLSKSKLFFNVQEVYFTMYSIWTSISGLKPNSFP